MEKVIAVLTSAITWTTLLVSGLNIFAEEIVNVFPDDGQDVAALVLRAVAILVGVVTMIRRVTPVLESQRGLTLPKGAPTTLYLD